MYDEIGLWSREKLDLLHQYLAAYVNILKRTQKNSWCKRIHYIDAFSGTAWHLDKNTGWLVDGSPRIALHTTPHFDTHTFIEINHQRCKNCLEPLKDEFSEQSIRVLCGDSNEILLEQVLPSLRDKHNERSFIFLDPYGISLDWETVSAIGKSRYFDIFINFSIMGIVRQLGLKPPAEEMNNKITRIMGTDQWLNLAYRKSSQLSLFGNIEPEIVRMSKDLVPRLAAFYQKRLKEVFKYVSEFIIMQNSCNGPLYALLLASQAKVAIDKMHDIFKRGESRGGTWRRQK